MTTDDKLGVINLNLNTYGEAIERWSLGQMDETWKEIQKQLSISNEKFDRLLFDIYKKYSISGDLDLDDLRKYNRLTLLKKQISELIDGSVSEIQSIISADLKNQLWGNAYGFGASLNATTGVNVSIGTLLDKKLLYANVSNPLNAITWIDRTTDSGKAMTKQLLEDIVQASNQGIGYKATASNIAKRYNKKSWEMLRVIKTEHHRAQNVARNISLDELRPAYDRQGIAVTKVWNSALIPTTRDAHAELNGKTPNESGYFKIGRYEAQYPGGFGIAEMDINCLCWLTNVITKLKDKYLTAYKNSDGIYTKMTQAEATKLWKETREMEKIK